MRTDSGVEGWIEQRSLVSQEVFDGFQKLAQDAKAADVQGHGTTRAELNMHLTPSREGEHLYQLKEGEKVEILKRATTDKNAPKPPPPPKPAAQNPKGQAGGKQQTATASSPAPTAVTDAGSLPPRTPFLPRRLTRRKTPNRPSR